MFCEETKVIIDHILEVKLIEHPISSDFSVSYNVTSESDQVEFFQDVVIEYFLELIGDEEFFLCGSGDDHLTKEGDVIKDTMKEEYEYLSSDVHINQFER